MGLTLKNSNGSVGRFRMYLNQPVFVSPLLDAYPNAAAAYSIRKLRTAYAGSAIRVRRSFDNAESDIGFDVDGNLDESALTTFVGANDGFVTTWYDQSGNSRNATQSTATQQPIIVSAGSILKNGNKPCIRFDNTDDSLITALNLVKPYSIYMQFRQFSTNDLRMLNSNNSNNSVISITRAANNAFTSGMLRNTSYAGINTNVIASLIALLASSKFYYNNSDITQGTGNADWGIVAFGRTTSWGEPANGEIKECVIYPSDQTANNTAINTNINTYYSIY